MNTPLYCLIHSSTVLQVRFNTSGRTIQELLIELAKCMMKKYEKRSAAKVKITGNITEHNIEVPGCREGGIQVMSNRMQAQ